MLDETLPPGRNPDPTEEFFKIIRLEEPREWDRLPGECEMLLEGSEYGRLGAYFANFRSLLEKRAKSALIECRYIDKDFRDVYSRFYSKKFAKYQSRCLRIHFFTSCVCKVLQFVSHGTP